ncbi:MAG: AraC family transcriptional regulator, partial [Clostridium sp.]|nr:AraC family transcriptional regulator [Clostridium sp.]
MEWLAGLKSAIDYMERHLLEGVGLQETADAVHISPFYFQRGFKIVTGYSVGEYLRNRRLYLAGLDVIKGGEKVIDLSYKYGYDTPESFTRAFTRFHGVSPMQLRAQPSRIRVFLPLTIEITIKGGSGMEY